MNALVKSNQIPKAESFLNEMEAAFYDPKARGKPLPNVVSYSTIMNGWAKSGEQQALVKTKETFKRMETMWKSGNKDAEPNIFSYVSLIGAITAAKDSDAAEEAEKILYKMYEDYQAGNISTLPSARLVTYVIDCWQKSGAGNAGERAEKLLDWQLEVFQKEGAESLEPDQYTFNTGEFDCLSGLDICIVLCKKASSHNNLRWCTSSDFCLGTN